jgi:hypothetical protein
MHKPKGEQYDTSSQHRQQTKRAACNEERQPHSARVRSELAGTPP